jgi:hypothetical protein
MVIAGLPGATAFDVDEAVVSSPRDTVLVSASRSAQGAAHYGAYSMTRDRDLRQDGSLLDFGGEVVISGHYPEFRAEVRAAIALDGDRGIVEMLDGITKLPRYCLQLQDNPRVDVVANTSGRRIIRDTATRDFFMLQPGEHVRATQLIVHVKYPPSIGNWSSADG